MNTLPRYKIIDMNIYMKFSCNSVLSFFSMSYWRSEDNIRLRSSLPIRSPYGGPKVSATISFSIRECVVFILSKQFISHERTQHIHFGYSSTSLFKEGLPTGRRRTYCSTWVDVYNYYYFIFVNHLFITKVAFSGAVCTYLSSIKVVCTLCRIVCRFLNLYDSLSKYIFAIRSTSVTTFPTT